MKTAALAVVVATLLFSPRAPAGPGSMCSHHADCGDPHRYVCVADCDTCDVGHCLKLHVLP